MVQHDVIIAGGGLVGGSLALALASRGVDVGLIEAVPQAQRLAAPSAGRALALSRGTAQALMALKVWPESARSTAIRQIHVSDRGHFGKARLSADTAGVDALGYVLRARCLEEAIERQIDATAVTRYCPALVAAVSHDATSVRVAVHQAGNQLDLTARLLVAADGANSTIRRLLDIAQTERDYGQSALVTEIKTQLPIQGRAFERFTASGPLAVLPLDVNQASTVWTLPPDEAEALLACDEAQVSAALQRAFGHWLGTITLCADRQVFPLKLVRAERMTAARAALIGNAMHCLHPVAGQGFNLGLRDAAVLAEYIADQRKAGGDIGTIDFLSIYAHARRADLDRAIRFTDSLVRIFSTDLPPIPWMRNLGLVLFDRCAPAKRLLTRHAMGYGVRG